MIDDPLLRELHITREAREKYRIRGSLYALSGNVIFADLQATRRLAHEMNRDRDLVHRPDRVVRAGDINAMGLIDEILHFVVGLYREQHGREVVGEALRALEQRFGASRVDAAIRAFAERFPPTPVYSGESDVADFLDAEYGGRTGREVLLEEMLMLRLENTNPAFAPFAELFDDGPLAEETGYPELIEALADHFHDQPTFGPDDQPLVEMLGTPARLFPHSLERQLGYMRERWGGLLGDYLFRLLRGLDVLQEESRVGFAGPGPTRIYRYEGEDPERFSPDRDWMPRVVIIAKSTLVWLDQLSRSYRREITRLDQIPNEELDRLAGWGFTGLWLIGLWERSAASRRIKQIMGNPEAEASAYALYEYEIASALGGWEALAGLRERCGARGIRLASDMVPNHTGIDGRWVIEHPDWFVQVPDPPFPAYQFSGENLSGVPDVGVYLEDHYYSHSDAAVVFRRLDFATGQTRHIYHGNDGTSMPWNDTAQLDFLKPEVREAVINTILHVARNFSIIRFDAAMTLAKRHIQRLWYPEPGSGGDIPSRAEHGMSAEEFNAAMPREFWREVVDRVASEAPDTLLLAEAFWMMEGYFVRTLGMHRVYNSAFMNMLKAEENAKYRRTIRNTIEFDKEVLRRFVNFMNNPDEETAVAQFGTGDKYIGVCTLMVTMPGLPMFGHGQVEGFTEKYGMEYRRAYLDEQPDRELVARHESEIFPLMRRRHLFSGVDHFLLYDLVTDGGGVNENVFAYTNAAGGESTLVLYNNGWERAWGWIRLSAEYVEKSPDGGKRHRRSDLGAALGLHAEHGRYCLFRDHRSGRWFIRESRELAERGLYVELAGYQSQVFLDFREVRDNEYGRYAQLCDELGGRGVEDVEEAVRDVALKPLLDLWAGIANSRTFYEVDAAILGQGTMSDESVEQIARRYRSFLQVGTDYQEPCSGSAVEEAVASLVKGLRAVERLPFLQLETPADAPATYRRAVDRYLRGVHDRADRRDMLTAWLLLRPLEAVYPPVVGICEEWGLIARTARAFNAELPEAGWVYLLKIMLAHGNWWERETGATEPLGGLMHDLMSNGDVTTYLGLNEYEGEVWFHKERLDELRWWLFAAALVSMDKVAPGDTAGRERLVDEVIRLDRMALAMQEAQARSRYRVDAFLDALTACPRPGVAGVDHGSGRR